MLEIIGLVLASGTIAAFARGRGAPPVISVVIAVAGYLAILFLGSAMVASPDARLAINLCAWAWVGAVALFVRFVVGAGRPKPEGRWACSNCLYSNEKHAVVCEACKQPYAPAH